MIEKYKTIEEHTAAVRAVIDGQEWNAPFDAEAHSMMLELLEHHPHRAEKEGIGIAMFFKRPTANGFPAVYLRRLDLSEDDFSWLKAIRWAHKKDASRSFLYEDVYAALRNEISDQIENYRSALRKIAIAAGRPGFFRSDLSGEWHIERHCHIDHVHPATFSVLVASFLSSHGIDIRSIETVSAYPEPGRKLVDRQLAARWFSFHLRHARLRVLSARENLIESKKAPRLVDLLDGSLVLYQRRTPDHRTAAAGRS